jgi:hypothetical protein
MCQLDFIKFTVVSNIDFNRHFFTLSYIHICLDASNLYIMNKIKKIKIKGVYINKKIIKRLHNNL